MRSIKVLIVDDSPTIRKLIKVELRKHETLKVVGEAGDPLEARELIKQLKPDVLTLDVEMPRMNGIEFLSKVMRLRPMPVVLFSLLTQKYARVTLDALSMGAFDCVGKPQSGDVTKALRELAEKVIASASSNIRYREKKIKIYQDDSDEFLPNRNGVVIGSSTGGVEALSEIISKFPLNCPPTAITQHMPPAFTTSFAKRLDKFCLPNVVEAEDGMIFEKGTVYIAPGGDRHFTVIGKGEKRICRMVDGDPLSGHRPSIDVLMGSFVKTFGKRSVGVILTGMGRDGAQGMIDLRQAGARTIGQDSSTSVVYGMPKIAFERGGVEKQLRLRHIADEILNLCSHSIRKKAV